MTSQQNHDWRTQHFFNRPTSFALSDRLPSATNSANPAIGSTNLNGVKREHGMVMDPFAAASSSSFSSSWMHEPQHNKVKSFHNYPPPPVTLSAPSTSSSSSSSSQLLSNEEEESTKLALQNLGWKIRSRVSQGYLRSHSTASPNHLSSNPVFQSERDILASVTNQFSTGRVNSWSRTKSAPVGAPNFESSNPSRCENGDMMMDEDMNLDNDAIHRRQSKAYFAHSNKRGRDDQISEGEEQDQQQAEGRIPSDLPTLSFSSTTTDQTSTSTSTSTSPSSSRCLSSRTFSRSISVNNNQPNFAGHADHQHHHHHHGQLQHSATREIKPLRNTQIRQEQVDHIDNSNPLSRWINETDF